MSKSLEEIQEEKKVIEELILRKKARTDMVAFCRYVLDVEPARHHLILIDALIDILFGRSKRLIVTAPPGSAKSTYCSIGFPAFFVAIKKGLIISASHNFALAEDFGKKVRNVVNSDEYKQVFPEIEIPANSRAAAKWSTNHGAGYYAAGVGTGIAGRRGDLAMIDDPYPSKKMAWSPTYRKEVRDWFYNDLQPRMHPGAPIILIQTRWHPEDLAGEILARQAAGERVAYPWRHINFVAIIETEEDKQQDPLGRDMGEALWPEWENADDLQRKKESFSEHFDWLALYQQKPQNPEGNLVNKSWFKYYSRPLSEEDVLYRFQTWDTASSTSARSAYTVGLTIAVTRHRNYYVEDMFRDKIEFPEQLRKVRELYMNKGAQICYIENKQTGASLLQTLRNQGMNLKKCEPRGQGDKEVRFEAITPVFEAGRLFLPVHASWRKDFETEVIQFPGGSRADIIDALSQGISEEEKKLQRRVRRGVAHHALG